ncbi:regulator of chromosome condensation 1/beta-lactamase-inhibitor protein II [Pavlovales sp. CCMP2436]|nr:regulator of chromosome condensation 1/beta-lactamase-inhibitor protein II [Pavlovales sp. CCMP2436]
MLLIQGRSALAARGLARAFTAAAVPKAAVGKLLVWGTGEYGKLGVEDANDREVPTELPALADVDVAQVVCGKHHTAALDARGNVWAWGSDQYGQLGLGAISSKPRLPTLVEALAGKGVAQIAAGAYHSAAVLEDGSLLTWGYGGAFLAGPGGLGHNSWNSTAVPKAVQGFGAGGKRAVAVSCGGYHTLALTDEGEVYSWGRGEWGRLGHGGAGSFNRPERLEQLVGTKVARVFACEGHSACIVGCADGKTLMVWGFRTHFEPQPLPGADALDGRFFYYLLLFGNSKPYGR